MIDLPADARVVLCDVWGCIHNGHRAFAPALAALVRWRAEGRIVVLVTNAPRPSGPISAQLAELGIDERHSDALVSSGDTGVALALARGGRAHLIGTARDRRSLDGSGLDLDARDSGVVICTGFEEDRRAPEDYDAELAALRADDTTMLCFNPDRVALHGEVLELCAGVIADRYAALGGTVIQAGKPYPPIYDRALALAGEIAGRPIELSEVVAIGDAIATDMLGAARQGFRFVFVADGIERERIAAEGVDAFLDAVAEEHDLGDFRPIIVADGLS